MPYIFHLYILTYYKKNTYNTSCHISSICHVYSILLLVLDYSIHIPYVFHYWICSIPSCHISRICHVYSILLLVLEYFNHIPYVFHYWICNIPFLYNKDFDDIQTVVWLHKLIIRNSSVNHNKTYAIYVITSQS
jgi:hypothetical protein